jgi:hypothetical protein
MKLQKEKTREDFKSLKEYQDYIDDRIAEEMIAKIELERQYYELEHDRTYI